MQGMAEGDKIKIAKGGILVLGPVVFARMATNKLGRQLLTLGMKLKPGASGTVPLAARIIKLNNDINKRERQQWQRLLPPDMSSMADRQRQMRLEKFSKIGHGL
jgi:hypothetical protein